MKKSAYTTTTVSSSTVVVTGSLNTSQREEKWRELKEIKFTDEVCLEVLKNMSGNACWPQEGFAEPFDYKPVTEWMKHMAYDPDLDIILSPQTGEEKTYKEGKAKKTSGREKSKFWSFVSTSAKSYTIPNSNRHTTLAKCSWYCKLKIANHLFYLNSSKEGELILCIACQKFLSTERLETEHFEFKSIIKQKLKELVIFLNKMLKQSDKKTVDKFIIENHLENFFCYVKGKEKYYGALYLYKICYNDEGNLWLMCGSCNSRKTTGKGLRTWILETEYLGQGFLDHLNKTLISEKRLLQKFGADGKGIAPTAVEWVCSEHKEDINRKKRATIIKMKLAESSSDAFVGLVENFVTSDLFADSDKPIIDQEGGIIASPLNSPEQREAERVMAQEIIEELRKRFAAVRLRIKHSGSTSASPVLSDG